MPPTPPPTPPPPPASRIVQITELRQAACLRCGRRLRDAGTLRADGRERCGHCTSLSYVIPAPAAGIALVVGVTGRELAYAQACEMGVGEFVAYLGLAVPFVPQPILTPDAPALPRAPRRA